MEFLNLFYCNFDTYFFHIFHIFLDFVERSQYAMILGNNTKFLVNYLYVAGSNLGH